MSKIGWILHEIEDTEMDDAWDLIKYKLQEEEA